MNNGTNAKTQLGTVLVFKPGTTKQEAEKAIKSLEATLDPDYSYPRGQLPPVNEFNPDHGGPVWYVP